MRYRQNRTVKWRMRCKPLETNWVVMYEGRVRVTPPTRTRPRPTHATAGNGPPAQKVSARATKHPQTSATTYPLKSTSSHPRLTLRRGGKQPLTPTIILTPDKVPPSTVLVPTNCSIMIHCKKHLYKMIHRTWIASQKLFQIKLWNPFKIVWISYTGRLKICKTNNMRSN